VESVDGSDDSDPDKRGSKEDGERSSHLRFNCTTDA
jgi:hypothetical protein